MSLECIEDDKTESLEQKVNVGQGSVERVYQKERTSTEKADAHYRDRATSEKNSIWSTLTQRQEHSLPMNPH